MVSGSFNSSFSLTLVFSMRIFSSGFQFLSCFLIGVAGTDFWNSLYDAAQVFSTSYSWNMLICRQTFVVCGVINMNYICPFFKAKLWKTFDCKTISVTEETEACEEGGDKGLILDWCCWLPGVRLLMIQLNYAQLSGWRKWKIIGVWEPESGAKKACIKAHWQGRLGALYKWN